MDAQPPQPGADELRMRAILRQRGVGPNALPPKPTSRPRDWLDDILDTNTPAPPPPAPKAPPQEPAVERQAEPPADHEPGLWSRAWAAATTHVSGWKALRALAAAVFPIPWTGYSAAATWAYTVSEARAMQQGFGYALAYGTFGLAVRRLIRTRSLLALWCTAVTFIGLFSAMSWYDPIQWLTGVTR